jgi:dinuclear metal center YbgI/SA1388 family protein
MKIKEVIARLEESFPLYWQEDFDNCGIQCGDKEREITGIMVCFDMSEKVLDEAISKNCNMVISHHPIIYKTGLKKIEPTNRVGKVVCKALENKLLLYSMHTNMDSGIDGGNVLFAQKLGLQNLEVLAPKTDMFRKLIVFVPQADAERLKQSLFEAGAGTLGKYQHCSYTTDGLGSFLPLEGAKPAIGIVGKEEQVEEVKLEVIFPVVLQKKVVEALFAHHPYEEPAFDILKLENLNYHVGLGRVGTLAEPMELTEFLQFAKKQLNLEVIKYSGKIGRKIQKVAVCGGGGASYVADALAMNADIYLTGDIKYHDYFIPENRMVVADIGHFEGENFIRDIIYNEINKIFTNFASYISEDEKLEISWI